MESERHFYESIFPSTGKTIIFWYACQTRPMKQQMKSVHLITEHMLRALVTQTEGAIYQIRGNEDSAMKLL